MPYELNVVLIEPEIPQNTGSVGRLCLATGTRLHLVKPYGFEITHSRLRRAGLDYWQYLDVVEHESTEAFFESLPKNSEKVFFSKKANRSLFQRTYSRGCYLIFGKETKGLPEDLLDRHADDCVKIPMYDDRVRSLNLANSVSVGVYEAIRQLDLVEVNP